jgi:N-acetyl-gamma-glutamylphosphate reductase
LDLDGQTKLQNDRGATQKKLDVHIYEHYKKTEREDGAAAATQEEMISFIPHERRLNQGIDALINCPVSDARKSCSLHELQRRFINHILT